MAKSHTDQVRNRVQTIISRHQTVEAASQAVADYVRTTLGEAGKKNTPNRQTGTLGEKAQRLFHSVSKGQPEAKEDFNQLCKAIYDSAADVPKAALAYVNKLCESKAIPNDARLPVVIGLLERFVGENKPYESLTAASRFCTLTDRLHEADQLSGWAARFVPNADQHGIAKACLIAYALTPFQLKEDETDAMGAPPAPTGFRLLQGSLPSDPGVNGMLAALNINSDADMGALLHAAEQVPESVVASFADHGNKQHLKMMRCRRVNEASMDFSQMDQMRMIQYQEQQAEIERRAGQFQRLVQNFGGPRMAQPLSGGNAPLESANEAAELTYETLACSERAADLITDLLNSRGYGMAWEAEYTPTKVKLSLPAALANASMDYLAGTIDARAYEDAIGNPWAGKEGTLRLVRFTGSDAILGNTGEQEQQDLRDQMGGFPDNTEGPGGVEMQFNKGGRIGPVGEARDLDSDVSYHVHHTMDGGREATVVAGNREHGPFGHQGTKNLRAALKAAAAHRVNNPGHKIVVRNYFGDEIPESVGEAHGGYGVAGSKSGFTVHRKFNNGTERLVTGGHKSLQQAKSATFHELHNGRGGEQYVIRDPNGIAAGHGQHRDGRPMVSTAMRAQENAIGDPWAGSGGEIEFTNLTGSDDILSNSTAEEPRSPYQNTDSNEPPENTEGPEDEAELMQAAESMGIDSDIIVEAMSRKHYKEVAAILKHEHDSANEPQHKEALKRIGNSLSTMFRGDNPQFDHSRFMSAAFGKSANESLLSEADNAGIPREVIQEAMSRQHYREVAAILKHEHDASADDKHKETLRRIGRSMSNMFMQDNPRFSRDKFMAASFGNQHANESRKDFVRHATGKTVGVNQLPRDAVLSNQGSDDAEAIKAHLGKKAEGYDHFYSRQKDGGYSHVWGGSGFGGSLSDRVDLIHHDKMYESEPDFDERQPDDDFENDEQMQLNGDGQSAEMTRQSGMGACAEDDDDLLSQLQDLSASVGGGGPVDPNEIEGQGPDDDDDIDFFNDEPEVDMESLNEAEKATLRLPLATLFEDQGQHKLVRVNFDGAPSELLFTGNWQELDQYAQANQLTRIYNRGSPYGFWFVRPGDTAELWINPEGCENLFSPTTPYPMPSVEGGGGGPSANMNTAPPTNQPPTETDSAIIDTLIADNASPVESVLLTFPRSQAKQLVEYVKKCGEDPAIFTVTEDRFRPALVTAQLPKSLAEKIKPFLREDGSFVFSD